MQGKTIIKVDIDSIYVDRDALKKRIKDIMRIYKVNKVSVKEARTHKGYHFYVEFPCDISDFEVIIIQLMLDSDLERELFNLERVKKGVQGWNVLFSVKKLKDKIVSRESDLIYFDVER